LRFDNVCSLSDVSDLSVLELIQGFRYMPSKLIQRTLQIQTLSLPSPAACSLASLSIFSLFLANFSAPAPNWECKCPTFFFPRKSLHQKK
jgi:hypothetical protein